MTKAQKENQARFKAVQAEAKKLKAKNPKLSHVMAVKQAWAIILGKPAKVGSIATKMIIKKPAIKKTGLKAIIKKVPKKMPIAGRLNLTGKETRLGYIPKKVAAKKPATSKHQDTKSHNVNIKVVSGIQLKHNNILYYKKALLRLDELERTLNFLIDGLITEKTKEGKKIVNEWIRSTKKLIIEEKQHIKELKKHI